MGVKKGAVERWEQGRAFPWRRLDALARLLEVPVVQLFVEPHGPEVVELIELVERQMRRRSGFGRRALEAVRKLGEKP